MAVWAGVLQHKPKSWVVFTFGLSDMRRLICSLEVLITLNDVLEFLGSYH